MSACMWCVRDAYVTNQQHMNAWRWGLYEKKIEENVAHTCMSARMWCVRDAYVTNQQHMNAAQEWTNCILVDHERFDV